MKFGKEKNEVYFTTKHRTYHLFFIGKCATIAWIEPHSFDEYVNVFNGRFFAFRWTTFFGFVVLGIGFAVSDFEQKKAQNRVGFRNN